MRHYNIDGIELDQFNEIMGELGYYDNRVYSMNDFDEMFVGSALEAILGAFHGRRFRFTRDSFNPYDEYFTYDGYDNLVSIHKHYLQEYFDTFDDVILEYVNDNEIRLDGVDEYDDE